MAEVDRQAEIVAKILDRHFYIREGGRGGACVSYCVRAIMFVSCQMPTN